jgi:hypothetical protein
MTKVKFSALISEMRGKLNGSVFTKNRYGNALRNKVTPVNRRTSYQQAIKQRFTFYSQKWRSLSPEQVNAWNAATEDFKSSNVFGDSIRPTGSNLFCALNANLALIGLPEITNPPLQKSIDGIKKFSLEVSAVPASEKFEITFDPSPTAADVVHLVLATRCYSPGKSYVQGEYRLIGTIPSGTMGSYDALDDWKAKFGTLVSGQLVSVKLVPVHRTTGCKSKAGNELASKVL